MCCLETVCEPILFLQDSSGYGGGRNYAGDGTSQTGGGYSGHPPVPGGPKPFDFKEWPSSWQTGLKFVMTSYGMAIGADLVV